MTAFATIVETSTAVAGTRSRLEKVTHLAKCLHVLEPDEVEIAVGFLSGELRQGRIGLGYKAIVGLELPPAAESSLTVHDADAAFAAIYARAGGGARAARLRELGRLMARATVGEQQFIRRLIAGELRQGAQEGVMIDAVARAAGVPAAEVRRATMLSGHLAAVARAALADGAGGLAGFTIELFRPVQPMLAQTAESLDDALARLDRAAIEWKLDGARIQVHRDGEEVRVFTRRLNDVTAAVPEVVEAALRVTARRFVLDGETLALDESGAPRPFQETMQRFGRRLDVDRLRVSVPITPYFFDCLHLDGRDLLDEPAEQRIVALRETAPEDTLVPRLVTDDATVAADFYDEALRRGHEGVVVKTLEAAYEAGRRGAGWLKVKPAHTLDLVVLAAEWGSGRRRGWLSNLHLGAHDPEANAFVMLGKTFKGLTDEMLAWQTEHLQTLEIARDDYTVHVRPELVVEIAFDGVQTSPQYPGGVALRFARVKGYRPDKPASEADTIETVRAIRRGSTPR